MFRGGLTERVLLSDTWITRRTLVMKRSYRGNSKCKKLKAFTLQVTVVTLWSQFFKNSWLRYFGHLTRRVDSLEKTDAGRDWGQEEKGTTEDEMAGWHHGLDECESEWTPGDGDGLGGLSCCDSWGRKELDATERLNWTELSWLFYVCSFLKQACRTGGIFLGLITDKDSHTNCQVTQKYIPVASWTEYTFIMRVRSH